LSDLEEFMGHPNEELVRSAFDAGSQPALG